jgi:hypothetical protein
MKGTLLSLIVAVALLAEPAYAQFGDGIVLDPTQSAHAAQQLIQGSQLYTMTIKTTQNVMETYNLAQHMATAPSSYYTAYTNTAQQTCGCPSSEHIWHFASLGERRNNG